MGGQITTEESGYYIIEVNCGNMRQEFLFKDGSLNNISAIVSKQYKQNDFITSFSDSSVPYVHKGESYIIQSISIRILDPITKKPVVGLGQNNSIIIQVDTNDEIVIKSKK
jgi:hypothetical protein